METGSTRVLVVPRSGGGWLLRETLAGPVLSGTGTKQAAVARATAMLEAGRGGEVVVCEPDGSVQRSLAVRPARRPWWYVRAGAVRWFMPVLLAVQLVLRLVDRRTDLFWTVPTVVLVVLLASSLVAVLRSQALDRRRVLPDDAS